MCAVVCGGVFAYTVKYLGSPSPSLPTGLFLSLSFFFFFFFVGRVGVRVGPG